MHAPTSSPEEQANEARRNQRPEGPSPDRGNPQAIKWSYDPKEALLPRARVRKRMLARRVDGCLLLVHQQQPCEQPPSTGPARGSRDPDGGPAVHGPLGSLLQVKAAAVSSTNAAAAPRAAEPDHAEEHRCPAPWPDPRERPTTANSHRHDGRDDARAVERRAFLDDAAPTAYRQARWPSIRWTSSCSRTTTALWNAARRTRMEHRPHRLHRSSSTPHGEQQKTASRDEPPRSARSAGVRDSLISRWRRASQRHRLPARDRPLLRSSSRRLRLWAGSAMGLAEHSFSGSGGRPRQRTRRGGWRPTTSPSYVQRHASSTSRAWPRSPRPNLRRAPSGRHWR